MNKKSSIVLIRKLVYVMRAFSYLEIILSGFFVLPLVPTTGGEL